MVNEEEIKFMDQIDEISMQIPVSLHKLFKDKDMSVVYNAMCKSLVLLGKAGKFSDKTQKGTFEAWLESYSNINIEKT